MDIIGTGASDTLHGTVYDDVIDGLDGNDDLNGGGGDDTLRGGAGDDRLEDRDGGSDTIEGGAGNDFIHVQRAEKVIADSVRLLGGDGNDFISFYGGTPFWTASSASIETGAGDDIVRIQRGSAAIKVGSGRDTVIVESFSRNMISASVNISEFATGTAANAAADRIDIHTVLGGTLTGWDQVSNPFTAGYVRLEQTQFAAKLKINSSRFDGWHEFLSFFMGTASQFTEFNLGGFTTAAAAPATTITGTEAGETLYGTAGDNVIEGLGGNDRIEGGFGGDTLRGGEGDDYLNGQTGHDTLWGGGGNDWLEDTAGGGDTLNGEDGDDVIVASRAPIMVAGTLTLNGGAGNDDIRFSAVDNADGTSFGNNPAAVVIDAGQGNDVVRLSARGGTVTVTLGAGADTLVLEPTTQSGTVVLTDFESGGIGDRVDLAAYLTRKLTGWNQSDNPFATGHLALEASSGTETLLKLDSNGGGNSYVLLLTFKNSPIAGFTAENFGGYAPAGAAAAGISATGTDADETISGTAGADVLAGLGGRDSLAGGLGHDELDGGDGDDRLSGGGGDDIVGGGEGADFLEDGDGGADQLSGGGGNDRIVVSRIASATPGLTVNARGDGGDDSFSIRIYNVSSVELDGGDGADIFDFLMLKGAARLTLGAGRDTIRLEPDYFGQYSNQAQVKTIVVADFETGPAGDFVDLADAMKFALMNVDTAALEPFRFGSLRLVQSGADTLLEYSYSPNSPFQTLFRFENRNAFDFTDENFGFVVPRTVVLDDAGASVTMDESYFGIPALRIAASDVTLTNAAGGRLEAGYASAPGTVGAAIVIEGAGATLVNQAGAAILSAPYWLDSDYTSGGLAILGSAHDDSVFNYGRIGGIVRLGAGDDYFFEQLGGLNNGGGEYTPLEMGAGDDTVEFDMAGSTFLFSIDAIGGEGNDTLIIRGITGTTIAQYGGTSGVEVLRLSGDPGASISFGFKPPIADVYLSTGLGLTVPARSSSSRAYTLPAAGTLHLEGGNYVTGQQASFAQILGSDGADRVDLANSGPVAPGTVAVGIGSVSLGGGDDYFRWGIHQARPGAVDGGAGDDRMRVDQITATSDLSVFTGFETVEHIMPSGALAAGFVLRGIDGSAQRLLLDPVLRTSTLRLEELQTPSLAVGAAATKVVIAAGSTIGSLADRYLIDPGQLAALAQQVENFGTILGDVTLGDGNDTLANHGSVGGDIDLGSGNDSFTGAAGSSLAGVVRGAAGDDVYIIEAGGYGISEVPNEGVDEVRTGLVTYWLPDNVEKLTATSAAAHDFRGNGGDNLIIGGAGIDLLRLHDGGADTAEGGGGNDVFLFGAALTSADQVNGGSGVDQIAIQGDYAGAEALTLGAGIVSVENVAVLPGSDTRFGDPGTNFYDYDLTTVDSNVASGVQMVVDANRLRVGEDFTFNGSAESDGSFFIYGGRGTDLLTGGAKNDVFYFGEGLQFGASDVIVGGAGIDQLGLRGNYTIVFGAGQLVGIEAMGLVSALDTRFGSLGVSYNYDLTMHDSNVAAGVRFIVDAAAVRGAETLTFDGSAESDGSFRLFGGAGADRIVGSQGDDLLFGRAGDDRIQGGLGADAIAGDAGADTIVYMSAAESTSARRDTLNGFTTGSDRIHLAAIDAVAGGSDDGFQWIGANAFSGAAGELRSSQSGAGWLVEGDTNGDGTADLAILVNTEAAQPLTQADFIF